MDGWTDDGRTDGRTDGWMNEGAGASGWEQQADSTPVIHVYFMAAQNREAQRAAPAALALRHSCGCRYCLPHGLHGLRLTGSMMLSSHFADLPSVAGQQQLSR